MFERIHQKLGTAGFVISIIALVAALGGGAYAASSHSGQATASAKAKQGKQGKQGKPGKTGPAGPAGPAGAQGPAGPAGPAGAAGPKGDAGAPGTPGTKGTNGTNGTNGKDGETGFTETLPAGKTETGTWNILESTSEAITPALESISFSIPLAAGGDKGFVFNETQTANSEFGTSGCAGTAAKPTAPPGTLCVYTISEALTNAGGSLFVFSPEESAFSPSGTFLTGFIINGSAESPARVEARGTWAVTAP
jgi:Collagen triple helix repeat (20 copies)